MRELVIIEVPQNNRSTHPPYASAYHPGAGRQRLVGAGGVAVLEEGLVRALGSTAWSG